MLKGLTIELEHDGKMRSKTFQRALRQFEELKVVCHVSESGTRMLEKFTESVAPERPQQSHGEQRQAGGSRWQDYSSFIDALALERYNRTNNGITISCPPNGN
jgi:hypothetical protein